MMKLFGLKRKNKRKQRKVVNNYDDNKIRHEPIVYPKEESEKAYKKYKEYYSRTAVGKGCEMVDSYDNQDSQDYINSVISKGKDLIKNHSNNLTQEQLYSIVDDIDEMENDLIMLAKRKEEIDYYNDSMKDNFW